MEVASGIHRLTQGVVNFYLVDDGGKLVLVDAGTPGDWDFLQRSLAEVGRTIEDVEAVLITHAHSDHTGFAERARADAGRTVWIHEADAPVAKGAKQGKNQASTLRYLIRVEAYRTLISLMRRGALKVVPIAAVSTFVDGETLALPGGPRVVHVPGHTPGMSAVFFESRRTLITGDSLVTRNPLTGRAGPQIAPDGLNADSAQALRSLDVLGNLPADIVLPGHGDPWTQGAAEAVRLAKLAGRS